MADEAYQTKDHVADSGRGVALILPVPDCSECYDTFNEEIRDMLENMDNPTDIDLSLNEAPSELETLENDFNKAIAEERYEDAGKLKEKINALKNADSKKSEKSDKKGNKKGDK